MWYNYITTRWIWIWGFMIVVLAFISAWVEEQTQENWIFYIVIATFVILIVGIIAGWIRYGTRKSALKRTDCHFLIPRNKYPLKSFNGAPSSEKLIKNLCVGIGTYTLFLEMKAKTNFQFDPIDIVFEGSTVNRPRLIGKDNPYIVETLPNGSMRNWWGNIISTSNEYTRYLYKVFAQFAKLHYHNNYYR